MSGFIGKLLGIPKATKVAGFQVQTSVYGRPIPIVYGTTRIAGNLLQMPTQPQLQSNHQSKASRATKGATSGEIYVAPILIGLCEGPIAGIGWVWRDKDTKVDFATKYAPDWQLSLGSSAPTSWTAPVLNRRLGYQFTAWVANASAQLPSGSLSQYSWEVQGFLRFNPAGAIVDASPADIVPDFLTNAQYGVGFASAQVPTPSSWVDYCAAAGLFCSPAIDTQKPAAEWLNDLCEIGNAALVWSDGVLKILPYGDTALTGNGHTYTPNTTPVYDLTDDNFLPRGGDLDPIQVTRTDPATAVNQVTIEYLDRAHDYNVASYTAQDQLAIEQYGVIPLTLTLHEICDAQVAQQVAQLRLQRERYVRNTYAFRLGFTFALLEPMDLVTLTDPGLGLNRTTVRLTQISEAAAGDGFDVVAEEWPFGTATATLYPTPSMTGAASNANVDPGNTNTPVIVEAPAQIQQSPLDLLIGASGGGNWGGCDVYVATDNVNFTKVGRIIGAAAYGTLTATLGTAGLTYPNTDTVDTCSVDITASGRTLSSYSATDFTNLIPLCYVQGATNATPEWIAFENATLTSTGHYNLTTLYRALYGSLFATHAAGKLFMLLDSAVARVPWPQGFAGQTIYFKLPAFNLYGAALQDVSTVSSFSYSVGGSPIPFQEAIPQATGSVDANGAYKITVNLPKNAASCKYLVSTGGFPSTATVLASGTVFTGSTPLTLTVTGTLTFGQTAYLTVVPFSGPSASGTQLTPINGEAAYLTFTASKTLTYPASSVVPVNNTPAPFAYSGGVLYGAPTTPSSENEFNQFFGGIPGGTSGVTLVQVAFTVFCDIQCHDLTASFLRTNGSTVTTIGNATATPGLGFQALTISLSENTAGRGYGMDLQIGSGLAQTDGGYASTSITYSMGDPKQAT